MRNRILHVILVVVIATLIIGGCANKREDVESINFGKNTDISPEMNWSSYTDTAVSSYYYDDYNKSLFLVTKKAYIYEMDIKNGDFKRVNMVRDEADYYLPIIQQNNRLYLGSGNGRLALIDIKSLETVKSLDVGINYMPSMIVNEDSIFYSEKGVRVNAIDCDSFEKSWSYDDGQSHMHVEPSLSNGVLYFDNGQGKIVGLDAKSGRKIKEFDASISTPFIVSNNSIIGANSLLNVEKVDINTGEVLWASRGEYRNLYTFEDELYAYDSERECIDIINENGSNQMFLYAIPSGIEDLKIDKNNIYIRYSDGNVQIYNKDNKSLVWEYMSDKIKFGRDYLILVDDQLLIPEGDGDIHAFNIDRLSND